MPEKAYTVFVDEDKSVGPSHSPAVASGCDSTSRQNSGVAGRSSKRKKYSADELPVPPSDRKGSRAPPGSKLSTGTKLPKVVNFASDGNGFAGGKGGEVLDKSSRTPPSTGAKAGQLQARAREILPFRQMLPITSHAAEIRSKLRVHSVLLLVGETGSGKSTQVPQFLVDEPWCRARTMLVPPKSSVAKTLTSATSARRVRAKVGGCIAITQPRRLAAISLASRVAAEAGTPLGSSSPSSQVGYSVRFNTSISPCTRIKYLTEGMLLQEMLHDPYLRQYSAVIIDEVHERSVNVDLLLAFLKKMVDGEESLNGRGGADLKVVVMSATADMQAIDDFFSNPPAECQAERRVKSQSNMEDSNGFHADEGCEQSGEDSGTETSWSGLSSSSPPSTVQLLASPQLMTAVGTSIRQTDSVVASCFIKGRQYPVRTIYTPSPVQDILESALHTIIHIHMHEALPGDVLVFLTGQEAVENLVSLSQDAYISLTRDPKKRSTLPKLRVLPLFAALPHNAQQRVFEKTPPRTRKVIISTNIAETSLTVPGIRYVIDSGKCKKKQFRSRLGLDSLLVKPISASAANQRQGRAGREAPGVCHRLYTEKDYLMLDQDNDPEILRCDLSQLVLNLKARGVDDVVNFSLLTSPPREALERALLHLLQLQALDPDSGQITATGLSIARLPLSASLGRVLIAAAAPQHDCLEACIDIISALSVDENIFLNMATEEAREAAEEARRQLYRREGDHLTLLATVQAYTAESSDRKAWCEQHFISHRAMHAVMDVRKQLLAQSQKSSTTSPSLQSRANRTTISPPPAQTPLPDRILQAFLTGFLTNTARIVPGGSGGNGNGNTTSYRTITTNQPVAIHPSSVLFGRRCEAIMYNDYVFTQRSYARAVSAVRLDWIGGLVG